MKKRSFFDRLSGSAPMDDHYDAFDEDLLPMQGGMQTPVPMNTPQSRPYASVIDEDQSEGQLPVDVYQTPNEIVIRRRRTS